MYPTGPSRAFLGTQRMIKLLRQQRSAANNVSTRVMVVIGTYSGVLLPEFSSLTDAGPATINTSTFRFFGPAGLKAIPGDHVVVLDSAERFRVVRFDATPSHAILVLEQTDIA